MSMSPFYGYKEIGKNNYYYLISGARSIYYIFSIGTLLNHDRYVCDFRIGLYFYFSYYLLQVIIAVTRHFLSTKSGV